MVGWIVPLRLGRNCGSSIVDSFASFPRKRVHQTRSEVRPAHWIPVGRVPSVTFNCSHVRESVFHVTVFDAKEFFGYTPKVLRAYVMPAHLDALTFNLPVLERRMDVKFI